MIIKLAKNSLPIPAEPCFLLPEGVYRGRLSRVSRARKPKAYPNNSSEKVRLVFEILNYCDQDKVYLAGKSYDPSLAKGSALRNDLESWEVFNVQAGEETGNFDLNTLVGNEADLSIRHIANAGHTEPFVYVEEIRPAGTLVESLNN